MTANQEPAPTLAEAIAQLEPFRDHHLYAAAVRNIENRSREHGAWEAAAFATNLAEFFEDAALRRRLSTDIEEKF